MLAQGEVMAMLQVGEGPKCDRVLSEHQFEL